MNFLNKHQNKFLFSVVVILVLGFSYLLLYRLGVHTYIDWDESIYAQVAKEAWQNKRFFDLTYFGQAWYEKPPLAFWLISASYAIGGISEWTGRLPSALAALGSLVLATRWAWEVRKSYIAAIFTVAGFYVMFPFLTASYFINLDTIVAFFVLLALYTWWKAVKNDEANLGKLILSQKWMLIFGAAIGLGVLTKNVVGLFPLLPILIYTLAEKQWAIFKHKYFWQSVGLGVLIAAPWHIYQTAVAGSAFWQNYLFYHVFNRFAGSLENNGAPFSYFFEIVFLRYNFALVVFGGGVLISAWLAFKNQAIRFVLVSAVLLFILFSLSTTKLPSYITVVLPLIIMLAGFSLEKVMQYVPRAWLRGLVIAVLVIVFAYTGYAFNTYKIAQGEFSQEYNSNRKVGEFLKDYRTDLDVYVNKDYKSLGIGYYANRKLTPTTDSALIDAASMRVFHVNSQEVFVGKTAEGKEYLLIKKY